MTQISWINTKAKKCKFFQTEVCYLDHIVSAEGVRTDPSKLQAILEFPVLDNVKALRSFLGLAYYIEDLYRSFLRLLDHFSILQRRILCLHGFFFCQETFDKLRKLLTSAPVLVRIS